MHAHDTYLRWLYRGGRPSRFGRALNRLSAVMFSAGIMPSRVATLEITGRKTGRPVSFPVVIADYRGERYLVSMLGTNTNWVRNLTAADGQAVLRHGRQELIHLEEIPVADRAPVLRRYLQVAPGGRPHIPRRPPGGPYRVRPDRSRLSGLPHPAPGGGQGRLAGRAAGNRRARPPSSARLIDVLRTG
jgi:deazaflavin-dependent oxidoreductase (nitroreductase family)